MNAFFVTGSGTDVGKTFIISKIVNKAFKLNKKISVIKPIISGFNKKKISDTDTGILLKVLKKKCTDKNIKSLSPWRFKLPLSPDIAARLEDKNIVFSDLVEFCKKRIKKSSKKKEMLLIEGVGGIMVPINCSKTILDLIKILDIPIIFITKNYLGSLSHTLTALEIAKRNNVNINSVIINDSVDKPIVIEEVKTSLSNYIKNTPIHLVDFRKRALPSQIDKIIEGMDFK